MAEFVAGEHITATKLNEMNGATSFTYHYKGSGNGYYTWDEMYFHGTSWKIWWKASYAMLGGAEIYIYKYENGTWVNKKTLYDAAVFFGETKEGTYTATLGEGRYRVQGHTSPGTQVWATYYPAQKNITQGMKLTMYEDFKTSGNRLTGSYLTKDILNAGRGGAF